MKSGTKAHIAVLSTNLFFAINFSLVKFVSPSLVKPYAINVLRVGISLLLFWLLWAMGSTKPHVKRGHWLRFFLCGLTGIAINQMFFIKGLTYTSAIHASLLILLTPILITVPAKLLAGIMIFLGVFLVSFKRGSLNKSLGVIEE